jgi:hypothetical protein
MAAIISLSQFFGHPAGAEVGHLEADLCNFAPANYERLDGPAMLCITLNLKTSLKKSNTSLLRLSTILLEDLLLMSWKLTQRITRRAAGPIDISPVLNCF